MSNEHQPGSPGAVDEIPKDHFDTDGNPCTLDTLCRREPAWAANIIRTLRARVGEFEMPDAEADRILTMSDEELDAEIRAVGIDPVELDKRASHVAKWAAECSKLRARVGELEEALRCALQDGAPVGCSHCEWVGLVEYFNGHMDGDEQCLDGEPRAILDDRVETEELAQLRREKAELESVHQTLRKKVESAIRNIGDIVDTENGERHTVPLWVRDMLGKALRGEP